MDDETINNLLTNVDSLINHTFHFTFDLTKPEGKTHKGVCVKYTDLQERRNDFLRELKNTVCSWVYGKDKYNTLFQKELVKRGYDYQNASSHIDSLAVNTKHVVHAASVFETPAVDFRYCHEGAVYCSG